MTQEEFKHLFIQHFGKELSEDFLSEHVYGPCDFPWHIFSFEQKDKSKYSQGKEAIDIFNKINKENAIAFLPFKERLLSDFKQFDSFEKLSDKKEIYVFDKDFKWCFILTHESEFGPYFIFEDSRN